MWRVEYKVPPLMFVFFLERPITFTDSFNESFDSCAGKPAPGFSINEGAVGYRER